VLSPEFLMAYSVRMQSDGYEEFYEFVSKLNCSRNLKFLLANEGVSQAMQKRRADCLLYYKQICTDFFEDDAPFKLEVDVRTAEKVKRLFSGSSVERTRQEKRLKEIMDVVQLELHMKPWNYKEDFKCIFNLAFRAQKSYAGVTNTEGLVQPAFNFHTSLCEKIGKAYG